MATSVSPSARCAGQGQCSEFTNGHSSGGTPVINNKLAVAALTGLVMAAPAIAEARDQIRIVGPSTVLPSTQAVSEAFPHNPRSSPTLWEAPRTAGRLKLLWQG